LRGKLEKSETKYKGLWQTSCDYLDANDKLKESNAEKDKQIVTLMEYVMIDERLEYAEGAEEVELISKSVEMRIELLKKTQPKPEPSDRECKYCGFKGCTMCEGKK